MDKSHVSMENKICPVCGKQHEHNCGVLLDRRLRDTLERVTVTGFDLCEEHEKRWKEGFVALVECDLDKSTISPDGTIKPEDAYRTGVVAHVKSKVFKELFNMEPIPVVFVDAELISQLQNMIKTEE